MTDNNEELSRLAGEAAAIDDSLEYKPEESASENTGIQERPLNHEIADLLDFVAMAGSAIAPTMPKHFNHDQNLKIADALILLAARYKYDLRSALLSQDSVVLAWVGLLLTVGMPARAVVNDLKLAKAKPVDDAPAQSGKAATAADLASKPDGKVNAVVSGG